MLSEKIDVVPVIIGCAVTSLMCNKNIVVITLHIITVIHGPKKMALHRIHSELWTKIVRRGISMFRIKFPIVLCMHCLNCFIMVALHVGTCD